jgi:hypothetical protein
MANGSALGKFGGEFGQGTQTYAGGARVLFLGASSTRFVSAAIYVFWFAERLRSNFLGKP